VKAPYRKKGSKEGNREEGRDEVARTVKCRAKKGRRRACYLDYLQGGDAGIKEKDKGRVLAFCRS